MSLKDKLTLIVPIRDRRFCLPRVMNFYRDSPCDVIFLDSTDEDAYTDIDPKPNTYKHVPGKNYCQKIHDCLSHVKTKYSVVVCDDDFLIFDELEKSINIIEDVDDNVVSFRGQSVALHEDFLSIETLDFFIPLSLTPRVERKERIKRAWRLFNGSIVHNVMLTSVQLKIHKFCIDHPEFNAINYFDKIFAILAANYGNNVSLPIFYIMKSSEIRNIPTKRKNEIKDVWQRNLSFEKDFLKTNLKHLLNELDMTKLGIEALHKDLISQDYLIQSCWDVFKKNVLHKDTLVSIYAPFHYLGHGQFGYRVLIGRVDKKDLLLRVGLGGDLDGRGKFTQYFAHSKSRTDLTEQEFKIMYPVLQRESLESIQLILKYVKDFPIDSHYDDGEAEYFIPNDSIESLHHMKYGGSVKKILTDRPSSNLKGMN